MGNVFFSGWKVLRYITCAVVAIWGFITTFIQENISGGRTLLLIAMIGVFSTMLFDMFDKHIRKNL